MSEFLRCLVAMFAVIAPFGAVASVRARPDIPRPGLPSAAAAFAVLAGFALLSDPLLDWLNLSAESFQLAASAAMFPLAARLLLAGDSSAVPERLPGYAWLVPFAVPVLAGPSSIIAVISYAARFGDARAVLASGIVLGFTALLFAAWQRVDRVPLVLLQTAARLSGALLIAIAVELAVNGVRSV